MRNRLTTKQAVWLVSVVINRLRLNLNFALRFAAWNSEVDLSIKKYEDHMSSLFAIDGLVEWRKDRSLATFQQWSFVSS